MNITFNDRDEFQRKQIAEKAIQLLQADIDISPMVIDGGWGTGKTEFCKKLISLMSENGTHHLIYVDAFQADHADAPLLTVLAEVIKVLPKDETRKRFIRKVIPAIRYSAKTLLKAGVSHLLRQDTADIVNNFDTEIQQTADKIIDASVESVLKDHIKASESLIALQDALKEIAQEKSIVLFVDELDRCRPNFAIQMLEVIKHTFHVDGVQFVLVTNVQQLKSSIHHCYGDTVDAQRYLDKFLKYSVNLPKFHNRYSHNEADVSLLHYKNLVKESSVLSTLGLHNNGTIRLIEHLIAQHDLSLREIETLVRHIEIYVTLKPNGNLNERAVFACEMLTLLAISIFVICPQLSHQILSQQLNAQALGDYLGKMTLTKPDNQMNYPDDVEVICYLIGSSAYKNASLFTPKDDVEQEYWEQCSREFFERGFRTPSDGGLSLCKDVLKVLSLY